MLEHHKDTAFLRQVILYDETPERHRLEERITKTQREETCVRRATWLMALFVGLSLAGIGYSVVFLDDPLRNEPHLAIKTFSVTGLGSFMCMIVFMFLGAGYRKELCRCREDCRRLAAKVLEARLGKPLAPRAQEVAIPAEPLPERSTI